MIRLAHILLELGRNLKRHPAISLGSLLSLTLLFLLFDLFWVAAGTSQQFYANLVAGVRMEAFVAEDVADSVLPDVQGELEQLEAVDSVILVTRQEARQRLAELVGTDLLVGYDSANPLPRSFVLTLKPNYLTIAATEELERQLKEIRPIQQVLYSRRWLAKAEKAHSLALQVGMVLGGLILLTALISSANNIRLMTQVRAVGLEQMRMLGAGRLFLAAPFLLESLLVSSLAAGIGWGVIQYSLERITFTRFDIIVPPAGDVGIYIGACALLGLVSGYLGIRKLIR